MIAVDEEGADGLSALAAERTLQMGSMGARGVHTVWCSNRADLIVGAKYAESLVLLDLPSAQRKQRDESVSTGESLASQVTLQLQAL